MVEILSVRHEGRRTEDSYVDGIRSYTQFHLLWHRENSANMTEPIPDEPDRRIDRFVSRTGGLC